MTLALERLKQQLWDGVRRQTGREALSDALHVAILFCLVVLLRPLFFRGVGEVHYKAPSVFLSIVKSDLSLIQNGARKHQPVVPEILSFVAPTIMFLIARRKLRWSDWEHGKAMRWFAMAVLLMLAWSGSTFPYNMYLGRGHGLDRILLASTALLSWRFPILFPVAVRAAIVMLKEAYVPIPLDDFDFRAPAEMMVVFGIFCWASISRSFKVHHFLAVGISAVASYYYLAGIAKWEFGPPGSWLNENHVSNISVSGYVRGWASWVPEGAYLKFAALAAKLEKPLEIYTLIVEFGALVGFFIHPKITRWMFLSCFVLNFGIFCMTGICFWKWMTVTLGSFLWMGRSGEPIVDRLHRHKLPLLFAIATIYQSGDRVWHYPQTHVVWYDTRFVENYEIYAIGESGHRYLVSPTFFKPMDMHWTQGRLCYATDNERSITGIYGTSGSYQQMKALERFTSPEQAFALQARGRICRDAKQQARFDDFMKTYFGNFNRMGRRYKWTDWIGRPTHLWVFPKGDLYDGQEKVKSVELWMTPVYHQGGKLHRGESRLTHTVRIH